MSLKDIHAMLPHGKDCGPTAVSIQCKLSKVSHDIGWPLLSCSNRMHRAKCIYDKHLLWVHSAKHDRTVYYRGRSARTEKVERSWVNMVFEGFFESIGDSLGKGPLFSSALPTSPRGSQGTRPLLKTSL